jgi:hypothetical protein
MDKKEKALTFENVTLACGFLFLMYAVKKYAEKVKSNNYEAA